MGPVDVRRVMDAALRTAGGELRQRARLVREYHPVPHVLGDAVRLGEGLVALLGHVLRHLPTGKADPEIRIRIRVRDEDGAVLVELEVTGNPDGSALTAPPAEIVATLGRELAVDDTAAGTAVLRLVFTPGVRPDATPVPPPSAAVARRVLVIDDEPHVARSVGRILREYEVVHAANGNDALDRVRVEAFDVVLCDLVLPGMSAMDVYREVREARPTLLDRFVFVTGGTFSPREREFLDSVPNSRLDRPFDPALLRLLVTRVIEGAQGRDA